MPDLLAVNRLLVEVKDEYDRREYIFDVLGKNKIFFCFVAFPISCCSLSDVLLGHWVYN
jgi:hypothetical protein